ncbi:MAG: anhydro-N-acetylmuramic acid kinase [Phycisphaerales bacterium]|nr:anhydro-N-acetylmuramic acid kinase [Planctomycetota bacterium]MCH8509595.1 anhydro-N-acetylmuramic acid kinase [Phycisphaerales bacterium]
MTPTHARHRLAIGCMSGTSLDGIDAVLIRAAGEGLGLRDVSVLGGASVPLSSRGTLVRLAGGEPVTASDIAAAAHALGEDHAALCRALCDQTGVRRPEVACVHGQTVWHRPPAGWQLLNPWPVARELGCAVVYDLRGADLAGGGQGAPLTPLADWVLFRDDQADRVIVNLGGFCNATCLPAGCTPEGVRAADLCACNQVLDAAARAGIGEDYDPDGARAARGTPDRGAVEALRAALDAQTAAGRSLGSGDEARGWIETWAVRLRGEDLLASACAGVGGAIGAGIGRIGQGEVYLAGGSARNRTLVGAIADALGQTVLRTDDLGVPVSWREAACFGVLGLLAADGVEIALSGVTGRAGTIPLSGAWIRPSQSAPPDTRQTAGMS